MKSSVCLLAAVLMAVLLTACDSGSQPTALRSSAAPTSFAPAAPTGIAIPHCVPTLGDELSPTYKPDAPVRSVVGHGHILTGVVMSSVDCAPIPNAKLELWPEEEGLGHPDEYRSTVYTDSAGAYRFECNLPDHIHMRISAPGYRSIASNAYHSEGRPEGIFNIVLKPEKP